MEYSQKRCFPDTVTNSVTLNIMPDNQKFCKQKETILRFENIFVKKYDFRQKMLAIYFMLCYK